MLELSDAVLQVDKTVRPLVEVSLVGQHRRGHGSLYAALPIERGLWMMRGVRILVAASLAACALTLGGVTPSPAAAAPSEKAGTAAADDVRSVYTDAAGKTHVTEWTPAPGVSTADLFKRLQQKGEQHLIAPSTLLSPNIECDFNGANAVDYRCVNFVHWSGTHPWVHILDHTGAQWPVYSSVSIWNQSTALDTGYGWYTGGCPAGALPECL
jgi:hypothetical protein